MAKTIFRKKKYRARRIILVSAALLLVALIAWALISTFSTEEEYVSETNRSEEQLQPGTSDEEQDLPAIQDTTSNPESQGRKPLPKEFIDRNTYSPHVVLYDVDNNEILYSKNAEEKCYPASLTKLLTALVALDHTKPEDVFTLGNELYMISPGSSTAYLSVGTKLTMEQLLQALLLPSGNDAAYAIAVQVGRIIENNPDLDRYAAVSTFLKEMNAKAKKLGCENTHFSNPDGYHDSDHYTTAKDMLYIARAAIQNNTIKTIVSTPKVTVRFLSGQSATWHNSNRLLSENDGYYYEGAFGLKTGTTDEAGKCLAACATYDGQTSIAIVMGSAYENGRWDDCRGLLDLSFQ